MSDRNQKKIRQKAQDFAEEKKKELLSQALAKICALPFRKRCLVAWSILFPKKPAVWVKPQMTEFIDKQVYAIVAERHSDDAAVDTYLNEGGACHQ